MKAALCASVLAILATSAMAEPLPGEWLSGAEFPACHEERDLKKVVSLIQSGDDQAFMRFTKERRGACIVLKEGLTLFVEDHGEETACVRPKGEIDCVWYPSKLVRGKASSGKALE